MPEKATVTDIFTEPNDVISFVVYRYANMFSCGKISNNLNK